MKKKTKEQFIFDAISVHGDKYDYSKVEYVNNRTKVCIICPIHGEFWQKPIYHIQKRGCPYCIEIKKRKKIYGKGLNDVYKATKHVDKAYYLWRGMLRRCYEEESLNKHQTYIGCSVCDEWLKFSGFLEWYNKYYIDGWQLDKDVLVKGNKVYSPKTCCFIPQDVNKLITTRKLYRGEYCIGVVRYKYGKYQAAFSVDKKPIYIGSFYTEMEAFEAYKKAKEQRIKCVADKYKGQLEPRVYEALYNYKVEITD